MISDYYTLEIGNHYYEIQFYHYVGKQFMNIYMINKHYPIYSVCLFRANVIDNKIEWKYFKDKRLKKVCDKYLDLMVFK